MDRRFVIALSNAALDPATFRWTRRFTRGDVLYWITRSERDVLVREMRRRKGISRQPLTTRTFNRYMGICREMGVVRKVDTRRAPGPGRPSDVFRLDPRAYSRLWEQSEAEYRRHVAALAKRGWVEWRLRANRLRFAEAALLRYAELPALLQRGRVRERVRSALPHINAIRGLLGPFEILVIEGPYPTKRPRSLRASHDSKRGRFEGSVA